MSMRTRTLLHLTLDGLLLAGVGSVQAANLGFLNDMPISYMKQRNADSVNAAVYGALDKQKDGETGNWVNQGAGNSVKIEVTPTPEDTRSGRAAQSGNCRSGNEPRPRGAAILHARCI